MVTIQIGLKEYRFRSFRCKRSRQWVKKQMSYVLFFCSKKAYQGSKVEKSHILQNKLSLIVACIWIKVEWWTKKTHRRRTLKLFLFKNKIIFCFITITYYNCTGNNFFCKIKLFWISGAIKKLLSFKKIKRE